MLKIAWLAWVVFKREENMDLSITIDSALLCLCESKVNQRNLDSFMYVKF